MDLSTTFGKEIASRNLREKRSVQVLLSLILVDVSELLYFFGSGRGKGETETRGWGAGVLSKVAGRGGVLPGEGGTTEGPGGCLRGIWGRGGGAKFFFGVEFPPSSCVAP